MCDKRSFRNVEEIRIGEKGCGKKKRMDDEVGDPEPGSKFIEENFR